ncbi:MAG: hypothetical protein EXR72_16635 [Myxococcales bacterium]|nr:hypothetical protein [Myxococcales bacterium]
MLLTWSRRDAYTLGFGPFPIIFSINLFLWFKPDWFYLQFLMVAVGFLAKEFIRWDKGGSRSHVFNPSSFPLGLVSILLILAGSTNLTWGPEIATTLFYPPHIYLFIFLIGLPGQFFFGVTTMTLSAVVHRGRLQLRLLRHDGKLLFLHQPPDCGLPRDAPVVHRSVHFPPQRARAHPLRDPLRRERGRTLLLVRSPRCPHLL